MKVTMNVECTPEEARQFFGLPDVEPLQEAMMEELKARMTANIQAMDPEMMMRVWFPAGLQNLEQMQKFFWSGVQQTLSGFAGKKTG